MNHSDSSPWILEFDQVVYGYPCSQKPVIQGLTLQIPTGKRCGLIGQNGCGKTTFFLLANGLYQPQGGTILWQGQPIRYQRSFLTQLRQEIGLVFQNPEHQLVASTVEEDLSYGLYNLKVPEPEIARRVQRAIAHFDLTELAHQPIHHLSLGQKKRLSIADVMILQPQLLLLDEPTAYLDFRHTHELIEQLQQIQAAGTTILLASHDLDFLSRWADWIFVMDQGQLILEGTPQAVFEQRAILEQLQLGVPTAMDLLDHLKIIFSQQSNIRAADWEQLQQQLLQARRYG